MRKFLATSLLLVLAATLTACPPAAVEKPVIKSFASSADTLAAGGGNVTLSWDVTGASSLSIDQGVGAVTPLTTGTKIVAVPNATTTYTLTAKNSAGDTVTATKKITVSALPVPTITNFKVKTTGSAGAGATTLDLPAGGGNVTFIYAATNATSLSINNGIGTVTGTEKNATVTTTTVYTLTATNATGPTTATVTVNVAAPGAPVITSSVPASGATGVAIANNTIVVNFDKEMNRALTEGAFSGVTAPSFAWNAGSTTATITFTPPAAPIPTATGASNTITYNFSNAAKSADGGTLAAVSRSYTTLKLVVASLDPVATLSGSLIFADGLDPGTNPTCGTGVVAKCAQNDYDPGEYRIGDSSGIIATTKVANPNYAYKGFAGFSLATLTALTPANLVSAKFSMTQSATPPSIGTPYALGTMKLQSISSAALATIPIYTIGTPNSFFYYTATTNSAVDFSSAGAGLKTATVTTQLAADLTDRVARGNRALFRLMFPKVPAVTGTFDGASNNDGLEDIADFTAPKLEIVYTQP